jgi:hypothetical protein
MLSRAQDHELTNLHGVHDRLRALLAAAEKGEYTKHAFWESVQDVLTEFYLCSPEEPLGEVAQQLPE